MANQTATFSDWPQESIDKLTEIIRKVFREEISAQSHSEDSQFLISLPLEERRKRSKDRGKCR